MASAMLAELGLAGSVGELGLASGKAPLLAAWRFLGLNERTPCDLRLFRPCQQENRV